MTPVHESAPATWECASHRNMAVELCCRSTPTVLLEVDEHLMGGPGKAHHESMERLRQRINFGKWHMLIQDGPSFFGGRHFTQLPYRSFTVDMTRFIRERLRPISLPRGRCLDRSAEASDGEVKALRAVAGSLSWVARQCRPDEAGTRLNCARFGIPSRSKASL